jgi:hypothetical protein
MDKPPRDPDDPESSGRDQAGRFTRQPEGSKGRQKGALDKVTRLKAVIKNGEAPLEFLLRTMRDKKKPIGLRVTAATAAAPYVHAKAPPAPKLNTKPFAIPPLRSIEDVKALMAETITKMLAGELDPEIVTTTNETLRAYIQAMIGFDVERMMLELEAARRLPNYHHND